MHIALTAVTPFNNIKKSYKQPSERTKENRTRETAERHKTGEPLGRQKGIQDEGFII
jgi:hypothetical protein